MSAIPPWEWALASLIPLAAIVSCVYNDTVSLTVWSTNLWDVIADGNLFGFYEYTARNIYDLPNRYMGCDIFAILPLSVWNFPIWLIQRFGGAAIAKSAPMLVWSKLGLEAAYLLCAGTAYKIALLMTSDKDRSLWAAFLTAFSCASSVGVGIAGQTDVFVVLYGALSVYALMKGQEGRALLFAAISVAVKPFFVFAFLPIVLLSEKNIFKAALRWLISFSLAVIFRLIGLLFPMYAESMSSGPSARVLVNLFKLGIDSLYGKASLFLLCLLFFCLIAYTTKPRSEDERRRFIVYLAAGVFMTMSVFSRTDFYRFILAFPYAAVLVVSNAPKLRFNMFLLFVYQVFVELGFALGSFNALSAYYVRGSLLGMAAKPDKLVTDAEKASLKALAMAVDEDHKIQTFLLGVAAALAVAAVAVLLTVNHPRFKYKFDIEKDGAFKGYDHALLLLNAAAFLPFLAILYAMYFHLSQFYSLLG